jgi:type IV secretory pathway TrbD component
MIFKTLCRTVKIDRNEPPNSGGKLRKDNQFRFNGTVCASMVLSVLQWYCLCFNGIVCASMYYLCFNGIVCASVVMCH